MSQEMPFLMPEGMKKEEMEAIPVNKGEWRRVSDFICRSCQDPAFLHPYTNWIWGCKSCGFTTYSVAIYFRRDD